MDDVASITRALGPVLVMLAWAALSTLPTRVTVGADGIDVRWLRRRRFIPYRSILRVVAEATASPRLRVALEAASAAEEGEIAQSLDGLSEGDRAEGQRRRARGA